MGERKSQLVWLLENWGLWYLLEHRSLLHFSQEDAISVLILRNLMFANKLDYVALKWENWKCANAGVYLKGNFSMENWLFVPHMLPLFIRNCFAAAPLDVGTIYEKCISIKTGAFWLTAYAEFGAQPFRANTPNAKI